MKELVNTDHKRNGSMMVEASLLLPVCLFFLITMAGAFQFLQLEETLLYSGFCQIRQCSMEMSMNEVSAKVSRLYLEHRIINKTKKEMGERRERMDLMGVSEGGMFMSPGQWDSKEDIVCRIYCSWSLGKRKEQGLFSDELRFSGRGWGGEDSISVWIFPSWGECYHDESCYISGGERIRTVQSVAASQGYRPCQHCLKGT